MEENIKCFCGNKSFHLLCTLEMCLRKIDITYEENFKFITTTYITRDEFESCKNILKENTIDKMSRNYLSRSRENFLKRVISIRYLNDPWIGIKINILNYTKSIVYPFGKQLFDKPS